MPLLAHRGRWRKQVRAWRCQRGDCPEEKSIERKKALKAPPQTHSASHSDDSFGNWGLTEEEQLAGLRLGLSTLFLALFRLAQGTADWAVCLSGSPNPGEGLKVTAMR